MRKLAAAVLLVSLSLFGCAQQAPTSVAPGDGPQNVESSAPVGEPTSEASDSAPQPAAFGEKISYPDGVVVEVIRTRQTRLTDSGTTSDNAKTGTAYTILSIRVRNGGGEVIDVSAASGTMTYGPDGEEAPSVYDTATDSMSGKVLPGKAKTGTYGFIVPKRYESDVTLEFSFDFDHGTAIFTGSIV